MEGYEKLSLNAKKSWIIGRVISTIIISCILIGGKFFLGKNIDNFKAISNYYTLAIIIIIAIMIISTIVSPIIEYKQWRYMITNDKIEFTQGIYFKKRVIIPVIRIQHIQLNQGPINKFLNLFNIIIFTAGGLHKIPNIEAKRAEEISEYLKELIKVKFYRELENCEENIILDKELINDGETR